MGAYSTGTVAVTNGSAVVTGTGTLFTTAGVAAGMAFSIVSSGVVYNVASVDSETQITLTGNYAESTDSGLSYIIGLDTTPTFDFPVPNPNDLDASTLVKEALNQIDAQMSLLNAGGLIKRTFFSASGTWTKHADTAFVVVYVNGGGGGGGSNSSGPTGIGGGGGGGGCATELIANAAPTWAETVTIGAAGLGATTEATSGTTGGTSSFGAHCSASGGLGGTRGDHGGAGGRGGTGSGGDLDLTGTAGDGGAISGAARFTSGGAAAGPYGGGGSNAAAATHGGGGSGTYTVLTNDAEDGGAGLVVVEEYY